jgi:hypothetical protein
MTTSPTPPTTADSRRPIISVKPVVLSAPERGDDLQVRISAPTTGTGLPVIVFSHGFSKSMSAYDPLVDVWASHGFVVVQPTHLDSASLGVTPSDPRYPSIWRTRVDDLTRVLDDLDQLLTAVPGLPDRVDRGRIAAAGHSWGGQSVGMLLGARVIGPDGDSGPDETDSRITAGVLLATTGTGEELTPFAAENFAFMKPDFSGLRTPSLVVAGDHDQSRLSTRGPDWFTDVYRLSPGAESLLTLFGGEHSLGGIHGYLAADTTDENPERVALIGQATLAYLRHALAIEDASWTDLRTTLSGPGTDLGRIESR